MKKIEAKATTNSESDIEEEKHFEDSEVRVQIETVKAYNQMLQGLQVNEKVMNADIHALFLTYNLAFFDSKLECVILEWSNRMTLCAGICYYDVNLPTNI